MGTTHGYEQSIEPVRSGPSEVVHRFPNGRVLNTELSRLRVRGTRRQCVRVFRIVRACPRVVRGPLFVTAECATLPTYGRT